MENLADEGLPFILEDLWRDPVFFDGPSLEASVFDPISTYLAPLPLSKQADCASHFAFECDLPHPEVAGLPALADIPSLGSPNAPRDEKQTENSRDDGSLDIWHLDDVLKGQDKAAQLHTWEQFDKREVQGVHHSGFLSEAGPLAFNAFIASLEPSNHLGALPQDYTLRAICNLALGRSSSLFQWDPVKKSFKTTIREFSVSGFSKLCSGSLIQNVIDTGNALSNLRHASQSANSKCVSLVALKSCINVILDAVEGAISERLGGIVSLLQLQTLLRQPCRMLKALCSLMDRLLQCDNDEEIVASLSDRVNVESQTTPQLRPILRALLARVSAPWLEQLATDMGFGGPAANLAHLREYQSNRDSQTSTTAYGDAEEREFVQDTKLAVATLRSQVPSHPVLSSGQGREDSPLSYFTDPRCDGRISLQAAKDYESQIMQKLDRRTLAGQTPEHVKRKDDSLEFADVWLSVGSQSLKLDELEAQMSEDVNQLSQPVDDLRDLVLRFSQWPESELPLTEDLSLDAQLTPLAHIRPLIETQFRLVNGILLRQLVRSHKLLEHLELQRSFHLLGNDDFVVRLSTALFSEDVQSAERRRGKLPTAEIMGLRLGATHEERWPPASSELQLALMGILKEAYRSQGIPSEADDRRDHDGDLPGSLSFAIRIMPEVEIDRVLDPNSIYALDFLRLQYQAPAPLDVVLTYDSLCKYDDIFKVLLRLLRMLHITKHLSRRTNTSISRPHHKKMLLFSHEAHHFVTTFLSHCMDIGITGPWDTLASTLRDLEKTLLDEDRLNEVGTKVSLSIKGLADLHDNCLERIRSRLFLKRKQEKLRNAVEGTLVTALKTAFALPNETSQDSAAFVDSYSKFKGALSKSLVLLQEQANKPPKALTAEDSEDAETCRILLARLDPGHSS